MKKPNPVSSLHPLDYSSPRTGGTQPSPQPARLRVPRVMSMGRLIYFVVVLGLLAYVISRLLRYVHMIDSLTHSVK